MTKEWVVIHDRPDNLCGDFVPSVNKLQIRFFNEYLEPLNHKFWELLRTQ
jgi:hypothetical protein